jgi:hypothetical protein
LACDAFVASSVSEDTGELGGMAFDCAQVCHLLAGLLARGSASIAPVGELCESLCRRCAKACRAQASSMCAGMGAGCDACAAECHRMLASLRHGGEEKPTGGPYAG